MQTTIKTEAKSKNRTLILKAAEKLFSSNGFRATTLKHIAKKSGANGALVSYYFGSKEGLREAVVARKLESLEKILAPLQADEKLSRKNLVSLVREIFLHIRKDEAFHRLAQRALIEDAELKKTISSKLWQPLFDQMSQLVQKATNHKISSAQAEVRCLILCGMFHQYANLRWFHKGDLKTSEPFDAVLKNFENYVIESIVTEICRS